MEAEQVIPLVNERLLTMKGQALCAALRYKDKVFVTLTRMELEGTGLWVKRSICVGRVESSGEVPE